MRAIIGSYLVFPAQPSQGTSLISIIFLSEPMQPMQRSWGTWCRGQRRRSLLGTCLLLCQSLVILLWIVSVTRNQVAFHWKSLPHVILVIKISCCWSCQLRRLTESKREKTPLVPAQMWLAHCLYVPIWHCMYSDADMFCFPWFIS